MNRTAASILGTLIIAVSLVWIANLGANTIISLKTKGDVEVKGFAKKKIVSNLGILGGTIAVECQEAAICGQELVVAKDKLKAYVLSQGVAEDEFKFLPADFSERYKMHPRGYATNKIELYVLTQPFRIESGDVRKIEQISAGIIAILNEGVHISPQRPEYLYTELDDLKVEMVGLATENAKDRAKIIASKGGFRLGPIVSVRAGVFQITPANSTDVSGDGINDTESIEKEIKSVVNIRYFVL